jgi:hemoglobin
MIMIVEYLRYTIDAGRQAAFIDAYLKARPVLLGSPYALAFEISQCVDDPLKLFRASPAFQAFFAHIRPYLKDIAEMRHYQPL